MLKRTARVLSVFLMCLALVASGLGLWPVSAAAAAPDKASNQRQGTWAIKNPMPEARGGLAVSREGKYTYVIDGWVPYVGDTGFNRRYDFTKDAWQFMTPDPVARAEVAGVSHGDNIYVVGGRGPYGGNDYLYAAKPLDLLEAYDAVHDSWETLPSMPTPRAGAGAAVVGNDLYVIGGRNGHAGGVLKMGAVVATVEVYDLSKRMWTTKAPMPTPRSDLAVVAHGGKIYAIGGWDGSSWNGGDLKTVEVYSPEKDTWSTLSDMPTARSALAAEVIGDIIYVIGGVKGPVVPAYQLATNEAYKISQRTWETVAPMPTARAQLGVTRIGGSIYALGGGFYEETVGGYAKLTKNEVFTP